ncbi:hypothetical protein BB561_005335 [Smittium simulii]|uniref:DASH complex subunit DAD1 n=1 Tax=Smittium simulii TaxID=133385 RepID=A0A2T9YAV8_9FUNG|nr:hypothetical protein BB561_005335 [Smittium simulii]
MEYNNPSTTFITERKTLLESIKKNLNLSIEGLDELNSNIESICSVGKKFEYVAELWQNFGQIMNIEEITTTQPEH